MTKNELVRMVAEKGNMTNAKADDAVKAVIASIQETLAAGGDVRLPGFGTFTVTVRPEREARNPRTGETMKIAEARVPKFKPGKNLKDAVNG